MGDSLQQNKLVVGMHSVLIWWQRNFDDASRGHSGGLSYQEPMNRSMQLHYIFVTAFS